ncbi:MAG: tetratricopeptide repeat protein [Nitrospinae bacterium]|nr:tetratricopeptide repeat protein [Nitrospinota bacterium]MBL7020518.1 tetratricopeptide repeat protein [Nitrospinaceae bacterium]
MRNRLVLPTICLIIGLLIVSGAANAFEVNKNAVALLIAKDKAGKTVGTGSGFVARPEGTLVTNYHVLVDAHTIDVHFPDGSHSKVTGVFKVDRAKDFAVIKLKEGFYSTLEIGDSSALKSYDYTSALGYLSAQVNEDKGQIVQTYGFVLGVHPQADPEIPFIYTTTAFGPGFSGGPVVNKSNQVIGLATLEGRSINLALPINPVKEFLDSKTAFSLETLLHEDKTSLEAMYYRGNYFLYGLGDPDKAITEFEKILAKDSNFVLAHYDLAVAYRDLGMLEKAIVQYEKTLQLNPDFPEALSNLGGYYFRAGKLDEAVRLFKKAVQVYPNFIQALSNLGAALNKQGHPDEAITYLKKALALNPEFAIANFNLGNSLFALNRLDESQKVFELSQDQGIDFLSMHWKLYEIHKKSQRFQDAENELKTILEIDPFNEEAKKKLSELPVAH